MTLPTLSQREPGISGGLSQSPTGLSGGAPNGGSPRGRQSFLSRIITEMEKIPGSGGAVLALRNLSGETDRQLFLQDLLQLGRELQREGNPAGARLIFGSLSQGEVLGPGVDPAVREEARDSFLVLSGQGGSFGRQVEFQMGRFIEGASAPSMILGMAVGSTVFSSTRSFLLPRLMRAGGALSRIPLATRLTASTLATLPEIPAFWGVSKGIRELMHPQSTQWDLRTNLHELAGLGITLGFLKSSGFVFGGIGQRLGHPVLGQQAGMLAGIMGGHRTEMALGLRPEMGASNFLTDSLIMWAQFNLGGALSHAAFPRLYAYNRMLSGRMAVQETEQVRRLELGRRLSQMETSLAQLLFGSRGPGDFGIPAPAWASLAHGPYGDRGSARGELQARDLVMAMSSEDGEGEGSGSRGATQPATSHHSGMDNVQAPTGLVSIEEGRSGEGRERSTTSPLQGANEMGVAPVALKRIEEGLDNRPWVHPEIEARQFRPGLPKRGGDARGPFENTGVRHNFARDMLGRLVLKSQDAEKEQAKSEMVAGPLLAVESVLSQLGIKPASMEKFDANTLNGVGEGEFGFALGASMRVGMEKFFQTAETGEIQGKRLEDFRNPDFRDVVRSLDHLMDIALYAPRAGRQRVMEGFKQGMGTEAMGRFEDLKLGLITLLSPQIGRDVITPEEGALSHGYGAMSSFLALLRHRIMPGGLTWRYQMVSIGPNVETAQSIRETGTYPRRLGDNVMNFAEDPNILAVGPTGYRGLSRADFERSFQFQLLNVKSAHLHGILTPEFVRGLPKGTILFEAIKGWIGEERGDYKPASGSNEQPTLLPFELVDLALRRHNRREDVEVVSGPGFLPADHLWRSVPVKMAFAGREFPEGSRSSPAAEFLRHLFAGKGTTPYITEVDTTHHQLSTELGGAMKNIASVLAGIFAVQFARENRGKDLSDRDFRSAVQFDILEPMEELLLRTLENEGIIKHSALGFHSRVNEDVQKCLGINLRRVRDLYEEVLASDPEAVPRHNTKKFIEWAMENIVAHRKEFADTRNPVMGVILGIAESVNAELGGTINIPEIVTTVRENELLTTEGTDSLNPFMRRNQYPDHRIELRGKDPRILKLHNLIHPEKPEQPALNIPEAVLQVFRGEMVPEGEVPPIEGKALREALEIGKSQAEVDLMAREIDRYHWFRKMAGRYPENERIQAAFQRQEQLLPRVLSAMSHGNPVAVVDFPFYHPPFENVARILMEPQSVKFEDRTFKVQPYYSYLRVNGPGIMDRLSLLGMYLRSFRSRKKLRLDVEVSGFRRRGAAGEMWEIEMTAEEILRAFRSHENKRENGDEPKTEPPSEIEIFINGKEVNAPTPPRVPWTAESEASYYRDLGPLLERLNASGPAEEITGNTIREIRKGTNALINDFMQGSSGWPSLVKYYAGPIQRGLKAGFTRPERQTMIGIYSEGRLVEAFMVFRGHDGKPRALNHKVYKELGQAFPQEYGQEALDRLPEDQEDALSVRFYQGLPLKEFLESYERMAGGKGQGSLSYRVIDLKSMPLEAAMAAKIRGVNPAVLRAFLLFAPKETRDNMFRDLENLYEMTPERSHEMAADILSRYLNPFKEQTHEQLMREANYRVPYKLFEKYRNHAYRVMVLRGTHRQDWDAEVPVVFPSPDGTED